MASDVVALVRHTGDLSVRSRLETFDKAVNLIGGLGALRSPFIVKPNIHCPSALSTTKFSVTSSKMVEAVVSLALKENKDLSIKIVESNSMDKFVDERLWMQFGYKELEDRLVSLGFDVSLVNLSEPPLINIKYNGLYFKDLELNKLLTENGYFVSVAVAKTHSVTIITGALKNLFGILPRKNKMSYHPADGSVDFNQVLLDMDGIIRPDLCVVDAIVGLEGVYHGRPRRINALIVGRNAISVDATTARLMGFEPESFRLLVEGEKKGLGTLNPKIVGESLEDMAVKFNQPQNVRPTALIDRPSLSANH
ncbi:MAG: hypothetical protein QG670_2737 [Thermoproteota archaeon]|nr:hypothetical protein [Thermoproteota archaeon]